MFLLEHFAIEVTARFAVSQSVALQVGLILVLVGAGWLIYRQLPASAADVRVRSANDDFTDRDPATSGKRWSSLDVAVSLYPVDIVAVRHEFFTEPRAGKRFEDFLKERMKGRSPINARLDKQGHGSVHARAGQLVVARDAFRRRTTRVALAGDSRRIETGRSNSRRKTRTREVRRFELRSHARPPRRKETAFHSKISRSRIALMKRWCVCSCQASATRISRSRVVMQVSKERSDTSLSASLKRALTARLLAGALLVR